MDLKLFILEKKNRMSTKSLIIFSIIAVVAALTIIFYVGNSAKEYTQEIIEKANPNNKYINTDKTISLTLPKKYKLKQYESDNYEIMLYSEDKMGVFITKYNDKLDSSTLKQVAEGDRKAYTEKFNYTSNISNVNEISLNETTYYTYSLNYLDQDQSTAMYLQSLWFEKNNTYYTIDIEFQVESLSESSTIITDVLNNIEIH